MKINIKALAISFSVVLGVSMVVISIWTRISMGFGKEFMDFFNSIHPHPFRATLGNLKLMEEIVGVLFDLFYTVVDSIIFSLGFGLLYNWIIIRSEDKGKKKG